MEKSEVGGKKCQIFGHFSLENAFCCDFFVIVLAGFDNFAINIHSDTKEVKHNIYKE